MDSRRDFLKFVGATGLTLVSSTFFDKLLNEAHAEIPKWDLKIPTVQPTDRDAVVLSKGLNYDIFLKWEDQISKTEKFGINNDFVGLIEIPNKKNEFYMWVNHESPTPFLIHGKTSKKSKEDIILEQKNVGGSLLHVKRLSDKNATGKKITGTTSSPKWELVHNSPINRRFDATTEIPFAGGIAVAGSTKAIGTMANCSGGVTPWNTFLSCEENYDDYFGKNDSVHKWTDHFQQPSEHYGWVVEINPSTQKAQKLTSLGRFEHEGATVTQTKDGRAVVYMGDDANNEHVYKFIASKKGSLEEGTLYVANLGEKSTDGRWEELSLKNAKLKNKFASQIELLIEARAAAKLVDATPLDRPEDIEILKDKTIVIACTNNASKNNAHGYILAIDEKNKDHESLEFSSYKWLECGEKSQISCPDNFTIDSNGNLWMTSDMSEKIMGTPASPYKARKHNGLFYIPTYGPNKGVVYQVASAPNDAEFTGPCFSPDFQTLFICVQHPGATSSSAGYTSQWPTSKDKPRSAVIAIHGPLLEKLAAQPIS